MLKIVNNHHATPEDRERAVREELGRKLGVDFCSPEDLAGPAMVEAVNTETGAIVKVPAPDPPRQVSVGSVVQRCKEAAARMSGSNPHRLVMLDAAVALDQLCTRLWDLEQLFKQLTQEKAGTDDPQDPPAGG